MKNFPSSNWRHSSLRRSHTISTRLAVIPTSSKVSSPDWRPFPWNLYPLHTHSHRREWYTRTTTRMERDAYRYSCNGNMHGDTNIPTGYVWQPRMRAPAKRFPATVDTCS